MSVILPPPASFEIETNVLIVGAGACGLTAALAASEHTDAVLLLERDAQPTGSTALSSGFIPAGGTRFQTDADSPGQFAKDIAAKAKNKQDAALTEIVTSAISPTLEWLADRHGLVWEVLDSFTYPGHSTHRMHAVPEKTGEALMTRLQAAAAHIPIATRAVAETLFVSDDRIKGVRIKRPDGTLEDIGCENLILACNGYGGNPALVNQHIPEMREALYFGHVGNQGEAIGWGAALGADLLHLSGYQGHGSVAHPHGILITWALMMEGGIQVNSLGKRFANEHGGYSEASVDVLSQQGGTAFAIYDARLHDLGLQFPDYQRALQAGAVQTESSIDALAQRINLPPKTLAETIKQTTEMQEGKIHDVFGRDFTGRPKLSPPYYAIQITGALFHTQGGLRVNQNAQVMKSDGTPFDNLYAGGGAACGVSGPHVSGYLSGNGLLTAFALGAISGNQVVHKDAFAADPIRLVCK